ncbi:MAG: M20 aminoacylase family protein, partial [Burkholderiaceae bacterium]|nr:M20 aminoacylase family protein [Burkholderiaceae bacterium]
MHLIDFPPGFIDELTAIRRDLHAHPELGYEEHRTSELIAGKLAEWGIPVTRGLGGTGVVGVITGKGGGRTVGLRADIDALPMTELNTFAHASQHEGKMHACGHDGHTAMLLGAARWLAQHRDFPGKVVLVFQPAEEGAGGAKRMIDDGLFEQFPLDAMFGLHNWPVHDYGTFGVRSGPMMAASNGFRVTIKGHGSHAAHPQRSIDPVMVAVQIAQAWQTIISRNKNPHKAAVLSVTQIHAGSAVNVIPDEASLIGTVRNYDADVLDLIERRMREIAEHTAAAFGATAEFHFRRSYPALVNHPEETAFAVSVLESIVGKGNVNTGIEPTMGAEDFAFYLREIPGCYVFIANGRDEQRDDLAGGLSNLHHPRYDFNDGLLVVRVAGHNCRAIPASAIWRRRTLRRNRSRANRPVKPGFHRRWLDRAG